VYDRTTGRTAARGARAIEIFYRKIRRTEGERDWGFALPLAGLVRRWAPNGARAIKPSDLLICL
jgi:hypothetical protein